jgi:hypothetical protein
MIRSKKRFTYTHKILLSIALILIIVFVLPFIVWSFLPNRPVSVVVIDKTTGVDYREHRSFFWLMHHWKYTKLDSVSYYNEEEDYYGFFPQDSSYSQSSQLQLSHADLLYITDTYGVYTYPVEVQKFEYLLPEQYLPIQLKYGGLTGAELDSIEKFTKSGGMSIAEFNTLQDPQSRDPHTQGRIGSMFGVRYAGALGKYYDDLRTAPRWMKDNYKLSYGTPWNFYGSGVIIIIERKRGDSRPGLVVLESSDLRSSPVILRNSNHDLLKKTDDKVPYFYFFEFVTVDSSAKVIAQFELQCTLTGKEKVLAAGLPLVFPAVVISDSTAKNLYFAGDFADNRVEMVLTQYWNVEFLLSKLFTFYFVSDQTRFFWKFYLPLMKEVLGQSYNRTFVEQQIHSTNDHNQ